MRRSRFLRGARRQRDRKAKGSKKQGPERPVKMVGEGGKLFILDDGGLPQNAIVLLQRYVKNNLRPQ